MSTTIEPGTTVKMKFADGPELSWSPTAPVDFNEAMIEIRRHAAIFDESLAQSDG